MKSLCFLATILCAAALSSTGRGQPNPNAPGQLKRADSWMEPVLPETKPWEFAKGDSAKEKKPKRQPSGDFTTAMVINPDPGGTGIVYSGWADNPDADAAVRNLAENLGNDPVRMYEWVRNNVRTEFYFGANRGAYLTMLERAGNDIDQCALLGALFRAAGYTPTYRLEWIYMPRTASGANQLGVYEWLGVDNDASAFSVLSAFSAGANSNGLVHFVHMWVTINIPGRGETRFVPSIKPHSVGRQPNLDSLSGYIWNDAAIASGSGSTGSYSNAVSQANLRTYFTGRSVAASEAIRSHADLHNLSGAELARLPVVVPEIVTVTAPSATNYPGNLTFTANAESLALTGIPTTYCGWYNVKIGTAVDEWFDATSLLGRTLAVEFDGNGHGSIRHDGVQVGGTETSGNSSGTVAVKITYEAPAAFFGGTGPQYSGEQTVARQNSVAIIYSFGRTVDRLKKFLQDFSDKEATNPANVTLGDRLQLIGTQYASQLGELVPLSSAYLGHDARRHFLGGMIYVSSGKPVVDMRINLMGFYSRASGAPATGSVFRSGSLLMGALEAVATEQHNGAKTFATPSLFDHAMTLGHGAHYLTSVSQLNAAGISNYSDTYLGPGATADIQAHLNSGGHVVLLSNSNVTYSGQSFGGYLRITPSTGGVATVIKGAKGSVTTAGTGTAAIQPQQEASETKSPEGHGQSFSSDPVDLTNGAFVKDDTDLVLGNDSEPNGLRLERNYNSARRTSDPAGLGRGWTHNYAMRFALRSANDFDAQRAGYDEVLPLLIAMRHAQDTLNYEPQAARSWLMSSTALTWAVNEQINSRASIALGARSMEFVRRPNGTYTPPSQITATLVKNGDNSHTLAFRHGNTINFRASDGKFTSITDRFNNTLNAVYDVSNRLQTVTDAYNRSFTFTYNGSGRLTGITDSTGRSVSYGLDGAGDFTFTDAEGKTQTSEWNGDYQITKVKDARGRTIVENDYDSRKQVWRQHVFGAAARTYLLKIVPGVGAETDPAGGTVRTYFDARGRKIFVTDQLNRLTQWQYDGVDRLVKTITPKGESHLYAYNANHVLVGETNEAGHSRSITPDAQHRPATVYNFEGQATVIEYWNTTSALVKKITAPGSIVTEFTYDTRGRLSTEHPASYAAGAVDTYAYDANGHVDKITHPVDAHTGDQDFDDYSYNARGDLLELIDRRDVKTTFEYNARRQPKKTIQWEGTTQRMTETVYDDAGDVDYVLDASGRKTDSEHDALGNLLQVKRGPTANQIVVLANAYNSRNLLETASVYPDASTTLTTTYTYHATQQVATVKDPLNRTTTFGYDENRRPTTSQTPLGFLTTGIWDSRGLKDGTQDAENQLTDYTYDKDGRMKTLANRLNKAFTWNYDDATRTVTSTTPTGKTTTAVASTRGLPATITEPSTQATTFNTYDAEGRLTQKTDEVGVTNYTYWPNGLLKDVTEGGKTTTRTYDTLNRLVSYADGNSNTIGYEYWPSGELKKIIYPGNKSVTYDYDDFGRLWKVTDWSNRVTTYTYDNASRLTRIDRPNGTYRIQEYDAASQLRFIKEYKTGGAVITFQELRYDDDGRITYNFTHPKPTTFTLPTDNLLYDDDNRLTNWNSTPTNVAFDADGNMTTGPLPSGTLGGYGYDSRNRLTSAGGSTYTYNPDGLRTAITGIGAATFVIDPNAALSRTLIRTKAGTVTYYVYGHGLLYEETNGLTLTYHADQVGSTIALTDSSQNITDRWSYKPFGEIASHSGSTDTPFRFNGEFGVMTDNNGLYYMRARYYNPRMMRFCNADPIGFEGGLNWYVFTSNNPITRMDPSGLVDMDRMNPTDNAAVGNSAYNPVGVFTVAAHANPTSITFWSAGGSDGFNMSLTAAQAAPMIVGLPSYAPGKPIVLVACQTGAVGKGVPGGDNNFAKQLSAEISKLTGTPTAVVGARSLEYGSRNGTQKSSPIGGADEENLGKRGEESSLWSLYYNGAPSGTVTNGEINDPNLKDIIASKSRCGK